MGALRDYSFRPETGQGLLLDARNTRNVPLSLLPIS